MKMILNPRFLRYFLISFSIYIVLLLAGFLSHYTDDILGKGFPTDIIAQLIFYTTMSLLGLGVSFGVLMASIFTFRYFSLKQSFAFKNNLLRSLIVMAGIALLFFGYNCRILPAVNHQMQSLLYDMRRTAPGEKFERSKEDLFKGFKSTMTFKNINLKLDTLNTEVESYTNKCDSLMSLLPDSMAKKIYNIWRLSKYGIKYHYTNIDTFSVKNVYRNGSYLRGFAYQLKSISDQQHEFVKEKNDRIVSPIELIILFLIGAAFGYCYNDQKPFLLVILGLFTTIFFYRTVVGFENSVTPNIVGITLGTITTVSVLLIITLIFVWKGILKEREITETNDSELLLDKKLE